MRLSITLLAASLYGVTQGLVSGDSLELLVYRDWDTAECTFASLRGELRGKARYSVSGSRSHLAETREERLRFINQYPERLWEQLHSLCGEHGAWDFPIFIDDNIPLIAPSVEADQQVLSEPTTDLFTRRVVPPTLEMQPLIGSGHSDNRVDLVFFSDGYTANERDKFISDANRLALDISGNQTFNTVKPLLNFWAAFVPSNESGIGSGGKPKDTPFGLFRDGTELRGVYYSKPEVARAACLSLGDKCDYPILMGNDPLYGGLGGEFTVITPSLANGALVLRHELGHSIIEIGEEYDGGYAYFGVNAANTLSTPIPWSHWFTPGPHSGHTVSGARVERSAMPLQAYAWTMLNTTASWSVRFNSSGTYARHLVRFSLSGLPAQSDLNAQLDGETLPWAPRPDIGVDRWHYDIHRGNSLSEGEHALTFTLLNGKREGIAQLCSAEILEFGDEGEFVSTPGHYGVFPTFSNKNQTSYRPTNEDCLMRIVTTPNFCKVCLEGLWLSLLRRVDLIDSFRVGCVETTSDTPSPAPDAKKWKRTLEVDLVPLAQFREEGIDGDESYTITWLKDREVLEAFTNKTRVEVDDNELALGSYIVDVQFTTPEVRVDKDHLLMSRKEAQITSECGA